MKRITLPILITSVALILFSCNDSKKTENKEISEKADTTVIADPIEEKVNQFITYKLTSDISGLSENQKEMLKLFFQAAEIMDGIFWKQAFGDDYKEYLAGINSASKKAFVEINYGPWERLNGNTPFMSGFEAKPEGANFYPTDMTKEEFDALKNEDKNSQYTVLRRNEDGSLKVIWYREEYKAEIEKAAELLNKSAELAEDASLKKYLTLRAKALLTDDYLASDMAWMDMKSNTLDFVVGPIENYEDALFGTKAAHEAYILIKDKTWSERLLKYAAMLPEMQKGLPVPDKYKSEVPGTNSDLGAYDVLFYAGDCNAGSKTIAINLPNDERVHLQKGSRRLQLKNAMRAKFDNILLPISKVLISEDQRKHITFDAFFENTMFHETAHGLGIKNTINGKGTAREALGNTYSAIEEGKADILGLYFVTKLHEQGEFPDKDLMDNYVTFMAGIFRSVRFGVSSSHGKANMLRFYYFKEAGAFTKDEKSGLYKIDMDKMKLAMTSLTEKIIVMQGNGDMAGAQLWLKEKAVINAELQKDLDKISGAGIPIDVVFEQGMKASGLQ